MDGPQLGDVVVYKGLLYFFQPDGSWCHLYLDVAMVGRVSHSVLTIPSSAVRKATEADYDPTPIKTQRGIDAPEDHDHDS